MKGKPNPRRAELKALSMQIRPAVKAGILPNINAGLIALYQAETKQTDFRSFNEWRKAGFAVSKGERGYPVWAAPRRLKAEGVMTGDLGTIAALNGIEPQGAEWFPVCYLFHAGQVEARQAMQQAA